MQKAKSLLGWFLLCAFLVTAQSQVQQTENPKKESKKPNKKGKKKGDDDVPIKVADNTQPPPKKGKEKGKGRYIETSYKPKSKGGTPDDQDWDYLQPSYKIACVDLGGGNVYKIDPNAKQWKLAFN